MNNVNILTVSEVTSFAPDLDLTTFDEPTVSGMLSQASQSVADYLGYSPFAEDIADEVTTGYVTTEGDLLIRPRKIPVVSISAIGLKKGSSSVNLNLTNGANNRFNLDYTGRSVRYPYYELALTGTVIFTNFMNLRSQQFYTTMSYRAGYEVSELPATFKQACLLFLRDIVSVRMNAAGATSISQGQIRFDYSTGRDKKSKFVLDAERLLAPYRSIY